MEEGLSAFSKPATHKMGERVNHVWKWAEEQGHDVVHQHASVIKQKASPQKRSDTAFCHEITLEMHGSRKWFISAVLLYTIAIHLTLVQEPEY